MPFVQARAIIAGERGQHFDPDVVDAFLVVATEFQAIAERYGDGGEDLILRQSAAVSQEPAS